MSSTRSFLPGLGGFRTFIVYSEILLLILAKFSSLQSLQPGHNIIKKNLYIEQMQETKQDYSMPVPDRELFHIFLAITNKLFAQLGLYLCLTFKIGILRYCMFNIVQATYSINGYLV